MTVGNTGVPGLEMTYSTRPALLGYRAIVFSLSHSFRPVLPDVFGQMRDDRACYAGDDRKDLSGRSDMTLA